MFRHVIAGVDGKPNGRDAIALGLRLVDWNGRLSVGYVEPGESVPRRSSNLEFDRVGREDARALLERELDECGVQAELLTGASESVAGGLHRLAREHDGDLLVVGSSHRGRIGRVLLGDHARDTLAGSPCAVAVAPAGYAASSRPLGSIGVAYDGSPQSRAALAVARGLAVREDAAVRALSVLSRRVTPVMAKAHSIWKRATAADLQAARDALNLPPEVERDVVVGVADERLTQFSAEVDLLVIGARDRGPLRRVLLGSTSQQLARTARCPLLVVAHGAPELVVAGDTTTSAAGAANRRS